MRAFVTGATGFIGTHLTQQLLASGHAVAGFGRRAPQRPLSWQYFEGNVTERASVLGSVVSWSPDVIFHLAAARTAPSLAALLEINVVGAANVIEAAAKLANCRVVIVGSSAVYGAGDAITEESRFSPVSPYGASKAALDVLAAQQFVASGTDIVRVRPFNVVGPGQIGDNVAAVCARQIVEAERGLRAPVVALGNLDAVRDFVDVRDVARALLAIAQHGQKGAAYNVCSGRGVRVRVLVEALCSCAQLALTIEERERPISGVDVAEQVGSYARAHQDLGWSPQHEFAQTARDTVDYARDHYT